MELSLIYKYQPKKFDDFIISDDMKLTLKTFIHINDINVLLIGDNGSGKTTLINAIINEYYGDISTSIINDNILYINSLKEQGISYYRNEVKTFCQVTSSIYNKKKILVLDDIDIINEQSQQVFRNCIDKYSSTVHFIASSNNPQKVIESLQSRLHIITIKPITGQNLLKIMNKITTLEKINIKPDAVDFIISVSNNSIRIMINYLEKCKLLNREISLDLANKLCTNIIFEDFNHYTRLCLEKNLKEAIQVFYTIFNKGYSVMDILDNYFLFVKITPMLDETKKYKIISLLCKYITIFNVAHEDEIELALFTNNLISL